MSQRNRDFSSEDRLIQNEEEAEGEMSQEIAILGTGAVGSSLGTDLIEAGYGSVHPGNGAWANLDKEGLCRNHALAAKIDFVCHRKDAGLLRNRKSDVLCLHLSFIP